MYLYEHAFSIKEHSVWEICFFLQNDCGVVTVHYGWNIKHWQCFLYVTNKMTYDTVNKGRFSYITKQELAKKKLFFPCFFPISVKQKAGSHFESARINSISYYSYPRPFFVVQYNWLY